ncbi:TPA: hypothetical protein DIC20_05295 [Candidatus Dependentiae bacterium]|nr:MAG: hypothetical protein US03_C0010G0027 [candidate division TM6 bacterium GW2011_GWF2_36_131]KKQ02786.1 MAG: hypothetical protein US13_C0010G0048 [candidate division TM6 bacterium GW2011_GWE2_36_25]KKQ18137.1 MAG: hypothetical protein US32_C0030G0004 [candidate division TM6 bacterium GW2011_GWA2_36_9]HBR70137.1 hypothetical protein [Candidatus Dependentiae bacterium]HCU01081.1 hypothetical protein [Candidatus Dependentiae bacterium]
MKKIIYILLTSIFLAGNSIFAMESDSAEKYIVDDVSVKVEALLVLATNPAEQRGLFLELQQYSMEQLSELLRRLCDLKAEKNHPLFHLCAQALIKKLRLTGNFTADHPEVFLRLFESFNTSYPYISDSLKMYMYFDLSREERITLNSHLSDHLSFDRFLEQNPRLSFLQQEDDNFLKHYDTFLHAAFNPLKYFSLGRIVDSKYYSDGAVESFEDGYLPVWEALLERGLGCSSQIDEMDGEDEENKDSDAQKLLKYCAVNVDCSMRQLGEIRRLIKSKEIGPNYILKIGHGGREDRKGTHILLIAVIYNDRLMVRELLRLGANPFARSEDLANAVPVIHRVLNLYPGARNAYDKKKDPIPEPEIDSDMALICRMIIKKAFEKDGEALFSLMLKDEAIEKKVLEIDGELSSDYLPWKNTHSKNLLTLHSMTDLPRRGESENCIIEIPQLLSERRVGFGESGVQPLRRDIRSIHPGVEVSTPIQESSSHRKKGCCCSIQ